MCDTVADRMKVYTRPYVNILAGQVDLGTGTFIEDADVGILTCEHVACLSPSAFFIDGTGSVQLQPGPWRKESDPKKDVHFQLYLRRNGRKWPEGQARFQDRDLQRVMKR